MTLTTKEKAELFDSIRFLCGYVENGTDSTVSIGQDDATRDWVVRVGKRRYHATGFVMALREAIADNTTIEEREEIARKSV